MKAKFNVYGMTCSACTQAVERQVKKLNGIQSATVNLTNNTLIVSFDEGLLCEKDIIGVVVKAGYKATVYSKQNGGEKNKLGLRVLISLPFAVLIFYISMGAMWGLWQPSFLVGGENAFTLALVQAGLFIPIAVVNYKYFTSGFKKLFTLHPNMDSLIATGALACIAYGVVTTVRIFNASAVSDFERCLHLTHYLQYEGASMILTLVTVGKFFEAKTRLKTGDALNKLREMSPNKAIILQNGVQKTVEVSTIKVGDILVVKEGMIIACDGVVISGEGAVNQSAITGESIPVYKNAEQPVFGGTLLESGYLQISITATSENSSIAKIINMVEEAGASKAPISSLADKIASVFVPVVIGVAIVTFFVHYFLSKDFSLAFNYGVSVLVISCPCALGLATPLAVILGSGKGAEHGVLIRSGEALQKLSTVSVVGFDKTGTLTEGKPAVVQAEFFGDKQLALEIFYALESKSSHPLAKAVCEYCIAQNVRKLLAENLENLHGRGVKGNVNNKDYLVANYQTVKQLANEKQQKIYDRYANLGQTPVFLADETQILAVLGIVDKIRKGTVEALDSMRKNHLKPVMITGDNSITAKAVASQLEIDYLSDVLPDDKRYAVKKLKNLGKVAFVGDGINDAPALAEADVGMAVGAGTDIAIENADIILLKNDMRDAVYAIMLGKRCMRTIKQNLFWAFFYNCLGIPLAAGVFEGLLGLSLTPAIASAMMSLSSLFVVGNSLKLRYFDSVGGKLKQKSQGSESLKNCTCVIEKQTENQNKNQVVDKRENQIPACELNSNNQKEQNSMKKYIYVEGMMCGHCKARVEKILAKSQGVISAEVQLEHHRALIECDSTIDIQAIALALTEDGYDFIREENL